MCDLGGTGIWSLVIWYLQGLLTPVIAIIAAYIAWRQAKTASHKLKLDLFDRRYKIVNELRKLISLAVSKGDLTIEELRQFMAEMLPAEFLFGPEIKELIGEVYSHGMTLWSAKEKLRAIFEGAAPEADREATAETIQNQMKWLMATIAVTADRFKGYLDLHKL